MDWQRLTRRDPRQREYFGSTAAPADSTVSASSRSVIRLSNALPSRRVRLGMYRAYTLKSISGLVCPSMAATQEGASPAARAFEAKVCRVWYMVRRRRPAAVRVGYQVRSRRAVTFSRPPAGPVKTEAWPASGAPPPGL